MDKEIRELNEKFRAAFGSTPFGEPVFLWKWSEDLFWPEFPTGNMVPKETRVPLIIPVDCDQCKGTGQVKHQQYCEEGDPDDIWYSRCAKCGGVGKLTEDVTTIPTPEYRKEKMCPHLDKKWLVTVWLPQESLGAWQVKFPGGAYPSRGYRIMTNATLPSYPGGPSAPNLNDTEHFIRQLRWQRSHTHYEAEHGIDDERTARDKAVQKEIEDEIHDMVPAFANAEPGKRGNYVSTPYTKKDLQ